MLKFFSQFKNYSDLPKSSFQRFSSQKRVRAAFDAEFYRLSQPDLSNRSNRELFRHYISQGWMKNNDPNAEFSVSDYLSLHKDVRNAGIEPLFHYITAGHKEGRTFFLSRWGNFAAAKVKIHRLNEAMEQNNLDFIRQQLPCEIARLSDRAVMSFTLVLADKLNLQFRNSQ